MAKITIAKLQDHIVVMQGEIDYLRKSNDTYQQRIQNQSDMIDAARREQKAAEDRTLEVQVERDRIIRLTEIFTSIQIMPLQIAPTVRGDLPADLRR